MKRTFICSITGAALLGLAAAQSSPPHSSTGSSSPDPTKNALKPLTPKSAMPAASHKPAATAPPATSKSNSSADAELSRLERQKIRSTGNDRAGSAKAPPTKSTNTSSGGNSGINATYQKPSGGLRASNPKGNSPNSRTPRVSRQN